jgi:hypothetical protein
MFFNVFHDRGYPALSSREMLVAVHQEKFVNVAPVGASELRQRGMCAGNINMLLCFGLTAEDTS